jgi:hypothetical protein
LASGSLEELKKLSEALEKAIKQASSDPDKLASLNRMKNAVALRKAFLEVSSDSSPVKKPPIRPETPKASSESSQRKVVKKAPEVNQGPITHDV